MPKTKRLILALALVLGVLSIPLWLPSLTAQAAPALQLDANPFSEIGSFYLFDSGYQTGDATLTVQEPPKVVEWTPGNEEATWTAETGFIMGAVYDANADRIYLTEQRALGVDSLRDLDYPADEPYSSSEKWPPFLTVLDANTGKVLSREQLDISFGVNGSYITPLGLSGNILYLSNFNYSRNLRTYDLATKTLSDPNISLCESGYVMRAEFLAEHNAIATLCDQGLTLTDLQTWEQRSIDIPQMGEEDYQRGNGVVVLQDTLMIVESDTGTMIEVDIDTLEIGRTINYKDSPAESSSLFDSALAWLSEQIAGSASAKRWMALSSISPDGRWLAIDSGFSTSSMGISDEIIIVDLETLEAVDSIEVSGMPSHLMFGADGSLLVVFESGGRMGNRGVVIDIPSREQFPVQLPTYGWMQELFAASE